jgi:hypothetical protein
MSFSTRIKSLDSRVKRLEIGAGKGQRCAYCRFKLRTHWPDQDKPTPMPEDTMLITCEFCHTIYSTSLAGIPAEEHDAFRLHGSFSLEDHYTNPKAYALNVWMELRPETQKMQTRIPRARAKIKRGKTPTARDKLRKAAINLIAQKCKRLEAKYGERPFPEQAQIIESAENKLRNKRNGNDYAHGPNVYVEGLFELERQENAHLIRSKLEKIIWGKTRLETASAIEQIPRKLDELIRKNNEANEEQEEANECYKEEMRLENLDYLNKTRARLGHPPLPADYGKK